MVGPQDTLFRLGRTLLRAGTSDSAWQCQMVGERSDGTIIVLSHNVVRGEYVVHTGYDSLYNGRYFEGQRANLRAIDEWSRRMGTDGIRFTVGTALGVMDYNHA